MSPITVCSLLVAIAAGQPPKDVQQKLDELEVRSLGTHLALDARDKPDDLSAAVAGHPDVQIAEAKLRIAQAELQKARQAVAMQMSAAARNVEVDKAKLAELEQQIKEAREGKSPPAGITVRGLEQAAARVKEGLAVSEAALRAATGGVWPARPAGEQPRAVALDGRFDLTERLPTVTTHPVPAGPAADKLRAALDKRWGLDLPADTTLHAAAEALTKVIGSDKLVIRTPNWASNIGGQYWAKPPTVGPLKGERPVGQWLQIVADAFTESFNLMPGGPITTARGRFDFYLRDYGLLFTAAGEAPAGAMTVTEFARQVAADEATKQATGKQRAEASAKPPSPEVVAKVKAALGRSVKLPAMTKQKPLAVYRAVMAEAELALAVEDQAYPEDALLDVEAGERTVAAWFDLLLDRNNTDRVPELRIGLFIREYGLLLARANYPPRPAAYRCRR